MYSKEYANEVKVNREVKGLRYPFIIKVDDSVVLVELDKTQYGDMKYVLEKKICNWISVTEIYDDIATKEKICKLEFINLSGIKQEIEVPAEMLAEKNKVVCLSQYGVDVNSKNSEQVVCHLNNEMRKAESREHTLQVGIFEANNKVFYVGERTIYKIKGKAGLKKSPIKYSGMLDVSSKGSYKIYKKMLNKDVVSSMFMSTALAIGASAPIVSYIGNKIDVSNLFVHFCGESTTGKSTALQLALSVFGGRKAQEGKTSIFSTWNTTQNAIQETFVGNYGITMGLDEAGMSTQKEYGSLIYRLVEGTEKRRMGGDLKNKPVRHWSTTIISTGEIPLESGSDKATGQKVRLLNFEGTPWTNDAAHSRRIKKVLSANYGFLGIKIAKKLLLQKPEYWVHHHNVEKELLLPRLLCDTLNDRIGNQLAIIMLSVRILNELSIDIDAEKVSELLVAVANDTMGSEKSIGECAFNKLKDYIIKNQNRIEIRSGNGAKLIREVTIGELLGVSYVDGVTYNSYGSVTQDSFTILEVAIQEETVKQFLKANGYNNSETIYRQWISLGHLVLASDKRMIHKIKMGTIKSAKCLKVKL